MLLVITKPCVPLDYGVPFHHTTHSTHHHHPQHPSSPAAAPHKPTTTPDNTSTRDNTSNPASSYIYALRFPFLVPPSFKRERIPVTFRSPSRLASVVVAACGVWRVSCGSRRGTD